MKMLDYDFNKFKEFKDKLIMVVNSADQEYIVYVRQILEKNKQYINDVYFTIDVEKSRFLSTQNNYVDFGHVFPDIYKYFELDKDDFHRVLKELFDIGDK